MNLKEDYNKWQLIEKEGLGNNEAYQFTKSELLDFAQYVVNKNIPMEKEKELILMPYGNHNGIVICCKNCGSEFEETAEGYYPPIKYENDKYNRECRRCLTELGTF